MAHRGASRIVSVALLTLSLGGIALDASAQFYGFYTDAPSYSPGDSIRIHASAETATPVVVRLVRHGVDWVEVARSDTITVGPQVTRIGAFVEVANGIDLLGGRMAFTLEGWFHPTLVGGDDVVIAGQAGSTEASAAIAVLADGRPAAYVHSSLAIDPAKLVIAPAVLALDEWHHLALSYDSTAGKVSLYVGGRLVAEGDHSGPVAANPQPFRIGARAEAPGDMTGLADGRFDAWALWPRALSAAELAARRDAAASRPDPQPPAADVDLYLGFEDPYGSIADSSRHHHPVAIVNHGTPSVAGVHSQGKALRLNHDQIVDAGWPAAVSIPIPDDAASGLYSVQALVAPGFEDVRSNELTRALVVRPRQTGDAPVAVIVPTNTWTAYSDWPGDWNGTRAIPGITGRARAPGGELVPGGNNSAYGAMGDGLSPSYFQGWRRPNGNASVIGTGILGHGHKGPQSYNLVRWLEEIGIAYHVYADHDLDAGAFPLDGGYGVVVPHGHHEYWSRRALDTVQAFQAQGGSVLSIAGNVLTWRVSSGPEGVNEIRKWPQIATLGAADRHNAMDGERAGNWPVITLCDGAPLSHLITGSVNHLVGDCNTECYGRWEVMNASHWLWDGEVTDGAHLGQSPQPGIFTIGHEADTFLPGLIVPPGLAEGETPVVLAEGVMFGSPEEMNITFQYPDFELTPGPTCEAIESGSYSPPPRPRANASTRAGSIVWFRHAGGGYVFSAGAVSAPWALSSDAAFGGIVRRALECVALDQGCPSGPNDPDAGAGSGAQPGAGGSGCGCRLSAESSTSHALGMLLALALALACRRTCCSLGRGKTTPRKR